MLLDIVNKEKIQGCGQLIIIILSFCEDVRQDARYLPPYAELIVCKNFKLVKKLGTGAFGEIYLAENRSNTTELYAAKLEEAATKFPQLYY